MHGLQVTMKLYIGVTSHVEAMHGLQVTMKLYIGVTSHVEPTTSHNETLHWCHQPCGTYTLTLQVTMKLHVTKSCGH